jgi:hypothetical protein
MVLALSLGHIRGRRRAAGEEESFLGELALDNILGDFTCMLSVSLTQIRLIDDSYDQAKVFRRATGWCADALALSRPVRPFGWRCTNVRGLLNWCV